VQGESFAGRYIPYIAAEMLDRKDNAYFDLSGCASLTHPLDDTNYAGALLYSPTIAVRQNRH
jgi:carboxypeptidase D